MAPVLFLYAQAGGSMAPIDFMKLAATVAGLVVSMPVAMAFWRASMFIVQLKVTVERTETTLSAFVERVDRILEDHNGQLTTSKAKLDILWEGHDRRSGDDRRHHHG